MGRRRSARQCGGFVGHAVVGVDDGIRVPSVPTDVLAGYLADFAGRFDCGKISSGRARRAGVR